MTSAGTTRASPENSELGRRGEKQNRRVRVKMAGLAEPRDGDRGISSRSSATLRTDSCVPVILVKRFINAVAGSLYQVS
jgi:hypothetical protein